MSFSGDVEITILDGGGAVVVPGATVQLVIGTSSAGTAAQVVATRNPNTLRSVFGYGPLVEAAALSCLKGGTVLALRATTVTAGLVIGSDTATVPVTGATNATPIVITATAHGRQTGDIVTIASVGGNTGANGTFVITKTSANAFSLNGSAGTGAYTSGGTVAFTGLTAPTWTGTSVPTVTGTPYDDFNVQVQIVKGGTIAATGITFKVSLDAGRHYGPTLALGTATTFEISGTGLTLNFAAGTLVAGDTVRFSTAMPLWDTGSVANCLDAANASQYAVAGWGSAHLVGPITGANAATINTDLENYATNFDLFMRMIMSARDAKTPVAWGGLGETESTWIAAIAADFASLSAKRSLVAAGHYNMPSAFQNTHAGSPSFRRSLAWAVAARRVTIPPQRHDGRVRDGSLDNISVDPTNDPTDGFIYHDEFFNPGLDDARFCSARTRRGNPGFFVVQPNLMSPSGSSFPLLPYGNVMDVACGIVHQVGELQINEDLRLNLNGTLPDDVARSLESSFYNAIKEQMIDTKEISAATVVVDRTNNVNTTKIVKVSVTIFARGYVLEEDLEIGFAGNDAAAA